MAQRLKRLLQCRRPRFDPWVRKIPWRRKWQPTPIFLPGESYEGRSLVGYSPWGHKQLDTTEHFHFHCQCHSIILTGNPMDGVAWWATVHGVAKESDTTLWLSKNSSWQCYPITYTWRSLPHPTIVWCCCYGFVKTTVFCQKHEYTNTHVSPGLAVSSYQVLYRWNEQMLWGFEPNTLNGITEGVAGPLEASCLDQRGCWS